MEILKSDVLIIEGGSADPCLDVTIFEKANIKRSGSSQLGWMHLTRRTSNTTSVGIADVANLSAT